MLWWNRCKSRNCRWYCLLWCNKGDFKTEILRVRANLIIYRYLSIVPSQEQNCMTQNFSTAFLDVRKYTLITSKGNHYYLKQWISRRLPPFLYHSFHKDRLIFDIRSQFSGPLWPKAITFAWKKIRLHGNTQDTTSNTWAFQMDLFHEWESSNWGIYCRPYLVSISQCMICRLWKKKIRQLSLSCNDEKQWLVNFYKP